MEAHETKLFESAKLFLNKKVWEEVDSSHLFAVQFSWMKRPVFVSVIGEKEEERGVLIYRSLEELSSYFDTYRWRTEPNDMSSFQTLANHSCIALLFLDREELTSKEYKRIKASAFSFRGKQSWPVFSEYTPGFVPEKATQQDEQLIESIAGFIARTPDFGKELKISGEKMPDHQIPYMVIQENGQLEELVYSLPFELITGFFHSKEEALKPVFLTQFELERVRRLPLGDILWELDAQYINQPMMEETDDRAAFPLLFLIGHPGKKEVLETEVLFQQDAERIQRTLIQRMIVEYKRPPQIALESKQATKLLPLIEQLLKEISVDYLVVDRLPFLSLVKENLRAKLDGTEEDI